MVNWIVRNRIIWSFKYVYLQNVFTKHISNIYVKQDLELNNLKWFTCHETQSKQTKPEKITLYILLYNGWYQMTSRVAKV